MPTAPGHHIRAWRLYRGLKTQAELAAKVGLTSQSISRLESGRMGYRQDILEKIAEALDCTPADLLSRDPTIMPFANAASGQTGMEETPREFAIPRAKVDRHPASGSMKGTFTIEPGYDITKPAFDDDEIAAWEAKLDRIADDLDARRRARSRDAGNG